MSLLVVTGPPGAGKSTVARVLAERYERCALIDGDSFFRFIVKGAVTPWLPESNRQNEVVTEAAGMAAGRYARAGYMTLYDGVVGPWFLPTFLRATGLRRLEYVVLLPSVERCVQQVRTRLGHGFHDEAATRSMHRQFAQSDMDRGHVLEDPPSTPQEVADLVIVARERGLLAYPYRDAG